MKLFFQTLLTIFSAVLSADAQIVINEIYAHGSAGDFTAADGEKYDWIELHNPAGKDVDLLGHFLTDRSWELNKWQFTRSFVVPTGGYRVVFASDLDALVMGQEHLNFKLSSGGEYLGLVAPDGTTIIDEFSPSYPTTDPRVTYGRPGDTGAASLLLAPTPGQTNSAAAILPSTLQFEITPNPAVRGSIVTARWETENADVTQFAADYLFDRGNTPEFPTNASLQFRANDPMTYRLAVANRFSTEISEIDLEILEAPIPFHATPATLATGGMTVLRWTPDFYYDPVEITLNDDSLRTRNGRSLFFPTNEVVMPTTGSWKKGPVIPEANWTSLEFDDSDWSSLASLEEAGFYRRKFDLDNPQELTNILIDKGDLNSTSSLNLWINGQKLSLIPDLGRSKYRIKPDTLRATGNILAVQINYIAPESNLALEILAWRAQATETTYPLTLTHLVDGVESTETINLTILPGDAVLPELPPVAISEFYGGDFGDDPPTGASFVEITNRSDETVDLRGIQMAGMLYLDLIEAAEPLLQPRQFGLIPWDPFSNSLFYRDGKPVIGVSEGPPPMGIEFPNGNPVILIDEYGRLIEESPPLNFDFGFAIAAERRDFEGVADDIESWSLRSQSPGEDRLEIEEFTVSPNVAQRGDLVTLSWKTSQLAKLEISNGVGSVTGKEGSIEVRIPDNVDFLSYRLTATGEFLVREKQVTVTIPPVIRLFQSNVRVIEPYQPVTIRWGYLLHNATLEPEPGLLPYSSNNEFEFFAGAGGFRRGERWSFLPADREFQPAWNEVAQPQGRWSSAETPIGVNRPEVAGFLPPNNQESTASHFRRHFKLNHIDEIERLVIDLLAEDGAVVFLNGIEALRVNMPKGEITRETQALSDRSTGGLVYEEFELDPNLLVEGENVLAVSLHLSIEAAALPVDQAFDLALRAERPIPENGRLQYTLSSENAAGRDEATLTFIIGDTTTLEDWQVNWALQGNAFLTDTDEDGLSDLLEFVTGSDPTTESSIPLWIERTPEGFLDISYQQELAAIGYQLIIESSLDLDQWQEINNRGGYSYEDDEIPPNSTLAIRRYRSLETTPRGQRFYRLRVIPEE